jgi:serine/threonine protein kinase
MMPDSVEENEPHSERADELVAGKYRIESEIGSGGMGVVYKAYREDLHSYVALKLLRPAFGFDPETVARFLQEARTAAALKSPHVARVQDFGTLAGGADSGVRPYIVMEYLTGQDLGEVLKAGVLPVAEAIDYTIQACHAIAEAHSQGIVHRDLKPANLFRDSENDIKVLDFGIAKPGYAPVSRLTRAGLSLGSPHYMSPEQIDSPKHVDGRADIYSFGICLYELLSGTVPFNGDTLSELVTRIVQGTPRPLQELRPDLPPGLGEAVHRAFARDPQHRYQKVEDFVGALAPYAPPRSRRLVELLAPLQAPTPTDFVRAVSMPPAALSVSPAPSGTSSIVDPQPLRDGQARPAVKKRWALAALLLISIALLFTVRRWTGGRSGTQAPADGARPALQAAVATSFPQPSEGTAEPPVAAAEPVVLPAQTARSADPGRTRKRDRVVEQATLPQAARATLNLDSRARQ